MRCRLLVTLGFVASACMRDVELPSAERLAVTPSFIALAPREAITFEASSGAGGYHWAFAQGGPLSGSDATLSADAGAYRAGSLGSAQDVIVVTDSAGATTTARIAVGARLSVSPALAGTSPGGMVAFTPSGGKPPYSFAIADGGTGSIDATGRYTAGATGDSVDRVVLSDATRDPSATATAEVHVGAALTVYRASTAPVAPREQLAFIAFGGQPPYAWSLSVNGSGGSIDGSGAYSAGGVGSTEDRVMATDANGQTAVAKVTVGPAMSLALFGLEVRPGQSRQLVASGGKAPYHFSFVDRGNRSRGAVDQVNGLYAPGPNVGAKDLLQVTDATGTTATLPQPLVVGPYRFQAPTTVGELRATDLNQDGRADLLLLSPTYVPPNRLTTFSWLSGGTPMLQTYVAPPNPYLIVTSSPPQVVLAGASGSRFYLPDFAGQLVAGPTITGSISEVKAVNGTTFIAWVGGACSSGWVRFSWVDAASVPTTCLPGTLPGSSFSALTTGSFGGDGTLPDLAWIDSPGTGPLRLLHASAGTYVSATLALPTGFTFAEARFSNHDQTLVAGRFVTPLAGPDDVAVLLVGPGGRARIAVATGLGTTPSWAQAPVDPMPAGSPSAIGLLGYVGFTPLYGAVPSSYVGVWNGLDGALSFGALPPGATLAFPPPVALTDNAVSIATIADVNGDGVVDLALGSDSSPWVDVLWGDGEGRFGQRAHFRVGTFTIGDVDGDGADDLVALTQNPSLAVLWGGGHQYAVGPETAIPRGADQLLTGDFLGARHTDALYQELVGGLYLAAGAPAGTFAEPRPLLDQAGALDRAPLDQLKVAHFGGAGGLDLLGYDSTANRLVAVVRDGPYVAHRVALPAGCTNSAQPVDLDGDGVDDVVTACAAGSGKTFFYTSLATGHGATLQFGAFTQTKGMTNGPSPALVGRIGSTAVFVQLTNLVRVDNDGGVMVSGTSSTPILSGTLGTLTTGGPLAVLGQGPRGVIVLVPDAGVYGPTQAVQAPGTIIGTAVPGRDAQGRPLPADVLMWTGEEVIPLTQVGGVLQ